MRWEGKVTQLDVRSWADGDKGIRTWCLGIGSRQAYQRQGLRKRWGEPLTQGGSNRGKALGDESWAEQGSLGGGAEHALYRPPLREPQSQVSDGDLTDAGPPALSPGG